jgi:tungstate transport system ATP-binding protein
MTVELPNSEAMSHTLNPETIELRVGAQARGAPIYRLAHVGVRYAGRLVLDIAALDIRRGEVLALVGPSGAGKSTLLRLLNFLEPPTAGSIEFAGVPVHPHAAVPLELRRQVTTVFQRPALLSGTVLANVAYGLQIRSAPHARQLAADALARVGLEHLADKPARTLSGGEMQRVALARALVIAPSVLLLDEPTANLDPHNVRLIERTIAEMHRGGDTTVVLVTHNIFQARRLAQRVGLLLDGRVVEIADTLSFFEAPRDPRTAAFVHGDMIY